MQSAIKLHRRLRNLHNSPEIDYTKHSPEHSSKYDSAVKSLKDAEAAIRNLIILKDASGFTYKFRDTYSWYSVEVNPSLYPGEKHSTLREKLRRLAIQYVRHFRGGSGAAEDIGEIDQKLFVRRNLVAKGKFSFDDLGEYADYTLLLSRYVCLIFGVRVDLLMQGI